MSTGAEPRDPRLGNRRIGIALAIFAALMFASFIARQWANGG